MSKREARRIYRELTADEKQRRQQARQQAEEEKEAILAQGRRVKAARRRGAVALRDAFQLLKEERQAQGLSLAELEARTGIGRAALSRLENDSTANPTVTTLVRYSEALGRKLVVRFE